jgi:transposase
VEAMRYIKGESREQVTLLPASIEDYVGEDNPVRVIDLFVDGLDMATQGYTRAVPKDDGRPGYDPRDLLKLYIYAYLNGIRSSRKMEKETQRNIELMWLLCKLMPDFKTIAEFRRKNAQCIKRTFREFLHIMDKLELVSHNLVAIDGSKFKAVNSASRNMTRNGLDKRIEKADAKIEAYLNELEKADKQEEKQEGNPKSHQETAKEERG